MIINSYLIHLKNQLYISKLVNFIKKSKYSNYELQDILS